jgi:multisubunit Na+/H+ antiporter MnhC subunit
MGLTIDHLGLLIGICFFFGLFYLWARNLYKAVIGIRAELFNIKLVVRVIGVFVAPIGIFMGLV